ncbi:MAG: small subunit ribosomal protein [Chloroflexia bacterium]|nr:small subunit ribosomal protein [Chloroflexia bacterium]
MATTDTDMDQLAPPAEGDVVDTAPAPEQAPAQEAPAPAPAPAREQQPRGYGGNGSGEGSGGSSGSGSGINMKALLEAGVHFGHQTKRWNPKMKTYIFTERNGIHIIDLQQTVTGLQAAMGFVSDLVANGGKVLFIGTKKQAQEAIREEAERGGQYFVNKRWMGGMLTNFATIRNRLRYLADLEGRQERGELTDLPKAEASKLEEKIEKLNALLGGIKDMRDLPDAVFIVDTHRERIAITEAIKLGIPVVAMVDTNADPDEVDYVIPSNDDAIRAVRVITARMADAALEGSQRRESMRADVDVDYNIEPGEYSFTPDDTEV